MEAISLLPISGEQGIAPIQPTGSQTLQERGMNLPVQAAMIPIHLTSPCSSQNMAPEVLIYVKNATLGAINPNLTYQIYHLFIFNQGLSVDTPKYGS